MLRVSACNVSWFPLEDDRWESRAWLGSETVIGGDRIFARTTLPPAADGPPIVMLHGLVVSGDYFGPVAKILETEYRVYIPDMPGFGGSTASRIFDIAELADAVKRWMDIHRITDALVVANSIGCQVATSLAVRHPESVRQLVLAAPTMDTEIGGLPGLIGRALRDVPRESQRLWTIWVPDLFASGMWRALGTTKFSFQDRQMKRLPSITQSVTCVAGERDAICPPPWVETYSGRIPGSTFRIIPGAAHAMNFGAPESLADIVRSRAHACNVGEGQGRDNS